MHPAQTGTTKKNNENLPEHPAKFHKSPMLSPEIMTNLGPWEKIHKDLRQADNSHNTQHKANAITIDFLIEISDTLNN